MQTVTISGMIQDSVGASTAEEGRARQFTASELQADLQPDDRIQGPGQTRLRPHLLSSANFSQFQSAHRKGHSTETAVLELEVLDVLFMTADDKAGHCTDRPRPVGSLTFRPLKYRLQCEKKRKCHTNDRLITVCMSVLPLH